jgi:hypothetical protein
VSSDNLNLLDSVSIIEMLSNSTNGSVVGYQKNQSGHIIADKIIDEAENKVFYTYTSHFQNGVLFAAKHHAEYIGNHVISSQELKKSASNIWQDLVASPSVDLSKAHAALIHNEVFGVGKFVDKSEAPRIIDLFIAIFKKTKRIEIISFLRKEQSAKSVWERDGLSIVQRIMLYTIIQTKNIYYKYYNH